MTYARSNFIFNLHSHYKLTFQVHVGDLRSKYNFHTLDLTELRAVWYALPDWNELHDPAKAEWKEGLKMKMDDMAYKLSTGQIDISETRNAVYTVK